MLNGPRDVREASSTTSAFGVRRSVTSLGLGCPACSPSSPAGDDGAGSSSPGSDLTVLQPVHGFVPRDEESLELVDDEEQDEADDRQQQDEREGARRIQR